LPKENDVAISAMAKLVSEIFFARDFPSSMACPLLFPLWCGRDVRRRPLDRQLTKPDARKTSAGIVPSSPAVIPDVRYGSLADINAS
jgi:hypothetical protein